MNPSPRPGRDVATMDLVMADMVERKRMGEAKYGVAHQSDNGRDHLLDLYEELLDAACYLRAELRRREVGL